MSNRKQAQKRTGLKMIETLVGGWLNTWGETFDRTGPQVDCDMMDSIFKDTHIERTKRTEHIIGNLVDDYLHGDEEPEEDEDDGEF